MKSFLKKYTKSVDYSSKIPHNGDMLRKKAKRSGTHLGDKMTYSDTAEYLEVTVRTVQRWMRKLGLPYYRIGGRIYFNKSDLDEWLKSQERGGE